MKFYQNQTEKVLFMKIILFTSLLFLFSCNSSKNSYIVNTKTALGLNNDDPVYINGVKSGMVTGLELAQNNTVNIRINLFPDIKISKGSIATISRNNALISNLLISLLFLLIPQHLFHNIHLYPLGFVFPNTHYEHYYQLFRHPSGLGHP